jgi:hypothetical protein
MSNSYTVLGLDVSATLQDVKKAFRKLALQHHPDKNAENPEKAHEAMVEVNTAYEHLTGLLSGSSASNSASAGPRNSSSGYQSGKRRNPQPPTQPQPQPRPLGIRTPQDLQRGVSETLSTLGRVGKSMEALINFFQDPAGPLRHGKVSTGLLALGRHILKADEVTKSLSEHIRQAAGSCDEWPQSRWSDAIIFSFRVRGLANHTRLVEGMLKGLNKWVEDFKKGEQTDQNEFAKLLVSYHKLLRQSRPWMGDKAQAR